jgi:ethanolamine utilization protein EutA
LISLGLDVGTTTTHQALWRLEPVGTGWGRPRLVAESPIRETPWIGGDLDVETLVRWHGDMLTESVLHAAPPDLGAALLTGEAARSPNARSALEALGRLCGGLVGTLAGARIESLLAGRASGAEHDALSRLRRTACLDIGGGTANAAIFHPDGSHRLANLLVGGRMVRMDRLGKILSATTVATRIARTQGIALDIGRILSERERQALCRRAADLCLQALDGNAPRWIWDVPWDSPPDGWDLLFLCGGIGECARNPPADRLAWGDLGPDLARAFLDAVPAARLRHPEGQAIRTTVSGVASRLVRLSGNTIWDGREGMPVRDLPVAELDLRQFPSHVPTGLAGNRPTGIAWSVRLPCDLDWKRLRAIAAFLIGFPAPDPLVVLVKGDFALALGQALHLEAPERKCLVLDRVHAMDGDFLDVGPTLDTGSIAVSLRSLDWPIET